MPRIVIDDLVILERVARGDSFNLAACHSPCVASLLKRAYSSANLPTHPKKSFFMDKVAHFWGADVFEDLGLVRPSWTRLVPLTFITLAAASLPALSISLLETLAGSWISSLTFRRRALCLLQEVYRLQRVCSPSGLVQTTCALKRELVTLCALAPLICTDLRAETSGYLVASDASDDLGAIVSARVSYPLARELRRHTPVKGLWSKLLSPSEALLRSHRQLPAERELPGESYRSHPLWTQLARSLRFKKVAVFRRRRSEHINIKELESYLAAEEALGTSVWESSRTISLLDSQVCVGALLKGRSSSFSLNSRTRASLPCLLFFNLHPRYAYVASEDNAADDPTRQRPVRSPVMPEPLWLRLAEDGNFSELDRVLSEWQLGPLQLQGIPELLARFRARSGRPAFPPGLSQAASCPSPSAASLPFTRVAAAASPRVLPSSSSAAACESFGANTAGGSSLSPGALRLLHSCSVRQFLWPSGLRPRRPLRFIGPGYVFLCGKPRCS